MGDVAQIGGMLSISACVFGVFDVGEQRRHGVAGSTTPPDYTVAMQRR